MFKSIILLIVLATSVNAHAYTGECSAKLIKKFHALVSQVPEDDQDDFQFDFEVKHDCHLPIEF